LKYLDFGPQSRAELISELEAMPTFLAHRVSHVPRAWQAVPGPNGSFSPVEQVWHLADLENMGFAERIRRLRAEDHPLLPDFAGDVVARERNYKSLSLLEGIEEFRRARQRNLAALQSLSTEEWTRDGEQEGYGHISLCDLPSMMVQHDESHREEIVAWLEFADQ